MVVLVVSLGIEVLSCTYVERCALAPAERSDQASRLEALQVCDDHEKIAVLFDVPVLLPGAPCLPGAPAERRYLAHAAAFAQDGFQEAIDHPPQFLA